MGCAACSIVFDTVIDTIIQSFFLCILQAVPCSVKMLYDLGVLCLFVTLTRSNVFRVAFSNRIVC